MQRIKGIGLELGRWLAFFALLGLALQAQCCGGGWWDEEPRWPVITVGARLQHDAHRIDGETRYAIQWFCAQRGLSYRGFVRDLRIRIKARPIEDPYIEGQLAGAYYHDLQLLKIMYLHGPHENALFHELLHRDMWLTYGHGDFTPGLTSGEHTVEFIALDRQLRQAWRERHAQ